MQYLAALLFILIVAAGGGMFSTDLADAVARLGLIEQDERSSPGEQRETARPPVETPAATEQTPSGPFDVAKIDPRGTSVFAGRSVANSSVTVFADGIAIGSANTDESGEWVLVVERPLLNPNPKLSVQIGSVAPAAPPSPPSPAPANAAADLRSAEAVSAQLMDTLRRRVERAKADAEQQTRKSEPATALDRPRDGIAERPVADVLVASTDDTLTVTTSTDVWPVPIKFAFREAQFTKDGAKAAQLLLDYLLLKKPPVIKLTGHADERGTAEFNMNLSADRLDTVSNFLRAGGYAGQFELLPKGDTAPFTGVDRTVMPRDQLYELDRRVELQISK